VRPLGIEHNSAVQFCCSYSELGAVRFCARFIIDSSAYEWFRSRRVRNISASIRRQWNSGHPSNAALEQSLM
jgi:hypothetical protein